ncbi:MAG: hypothetical protein AAB110_01880, partial [Candidatus Desantisbacteria bacterium]
GIVIVLPLINLPSESEYNQESPGYYTNFAGMQGIEELWTALRKSPPGRVLVPTSSMPLRIKPFGHTHIMSLIPIFTDKEIIGGTPTMLTPMSVFLYYGYARDKVANFAESFDRVSLFGMRYEDIDEVRLHKICKHLDITTVVVWMCDQQIVDFFLNNKYFSCRTQAGNFLLFDIKEYSHNLIETNSDMANVKLFEYKPDRIRINILNASEGAEMLLKVSYYPLWQAYIGKKKMEIGMDEAGLMKVKLPKGKDYVVEFRYENGDVEKIGSYISLFAICMIVMMGCYQIYLKLYRPV